MRLLFITHEYPNFVPDLLLHGLRELLGPDVVDYPRKDCVYDGCLGLGVCPEDARLSNWFPSDEGLDRDDIPAKLRNGFFDGVIADIRGLSVLEAMDCSVEVPLALIDGEDRPTPLPCHEYTVFRRETDGTDGSVPLPMALPAELFEAIGALPERPKVFSVGFLGAAGAAAEDPRREVIEALQDAYPDGLFSSDNYPSPEDPNPTARLGRLEYYAQLQRCRALVSLPGAGYDTFRFWEHAASRAVHVAPTMPLAIPKDFEDGINILRFGSLDGLQRAVDRVLAMPDAGAELSQTSRAHVAPHHLTCARAKYMLDRWGL